MRVLLWTLVALLNWTSTPCVMAEESGEANAEEAEEPTEDKYEHCYGWAAKGECEANAEYMKLACPKACAQAAKEKEAMLKEVESIESIHELSAKDMDGNVVKFGDYEGYVIVFVNVIAADNMMSEAHYEGLVKLQERVKGEKVKFFLFPTEQFVHGEDKLPEDQDDLLAYFTNKGLLDDGTIFTIMETVEVNGPNAHILFKFAKYDAAPVVPGIAWNFDPYFLVHPSGELESRHRVHPEQLFEPIMEHFGSQEL